MAAPTTHRRLLISDAVINLVLGALLLLAPLGTLSLVGVPTPSTFLFTATLGGVLMGIGVALVASARGMPGLGLVGAIAINACGAIALVGWLVTTDVELAPRGAATLWGIAAVVLAVALVELASRPWRRG
jgi:hypothetical protein